MPRNAPKALFSLCVCFLAFLIVSRIALVPSAGSRADQPSHFDKLVLEFAAAIENSAKELPSTPAVLVLDFDERLEHSAYTQVPPAPLAKAGERSELWHALAQQFAEALQEQERGFILLNRNDLLRAIQIHNLPLTLLSNVPAMKCYSADLGALSSSPGASNMRLMELSLGLSRSSQKATGKPFMARLRRFE
jgi:hypothetical protein